MKRKGCVLYSILDIRMEDNERIRASCYTDLLRKFPSVRNEDFHTLMTLEQRSFADESRFDKTRYLCNKTMNSEAYL